MSVQVGHVSIEYYQPLDCIVSEFVSELMWRKSLDCYMSGEGRVWTYFSFSEMTHYAVEFVEDFKDHETRLETIRNWMDTLPWCGKGESAHGDNRYIELYLRG